ncbi:MAG: hypothetical protein JO208_11745 [Alphaproteobacteria bacterium]|nr:hypothetical protein [Alphaproteobacteria bacterium]
MLAPVELKSNSYSPAARAKHLLLAGGVLGLTMASCGGASAYQLKTLYSFCAKTACSDGSIPVGGLVRDSAGNLYGVAQTGGDRNQGVVFRLTYDAGKDAWKYDRIYSFCKRSSCRRGGPVDPLIVDSSGNLYGTSGETAFELSPSGSGDWDFKGLHKFNDQDHSGLEPSSGLTYSGRDAGVPYDGQSPLYGVTLFGGTGDWPSHCTGCGVLYALQPHGQKWRETVLYNFCSAGSGCADGAFPARMITIGNSGTVYGTTFEGGTKNKGIVYAVSGSALTVLHSFCTLNQCRDGSEGEGLVKDAQGNLYGVADSNKGGAAFQVTPAGQYNLLYAFCQTDGCADGQSPSGQLLLAGGDIFGTTLLGGANGQGVAYKLSGGAESVLYDFCAQSGCTDGRGPDAALVMDGAGDLFGTTLYGGAAGEGSVFELIP